MILPKYWWRDKTLRDLPPETQDRIPRLFSATDPDAFGSFNPDIAVIASRAMSFTEDEVDTLLEALKKTGAVVAHKNRYWWSMWLAQGWNQYRKDFSSRHEIPPCVSKDLQLSVKRRSTASIAGHRRSLPNTTTTQKKKDTEWHSKFVEELKKCYVDLAVDTWSEKGALYVAKRLGREKARKFVRYMQGRAETRYLCKPKNALSEYDWESGVYKGNGQPEKSIYAKPLFKEENNAEP